jgi:hypothetical protein
MGFGIGFFFGNCIDWDRSEALRFAARRIQHTRPKPPMT